MNINIEEGNLIGIITPWFVYRVSVQIVDFGVQVEPGVLIHVRIKPIVR